MVYAVGQLEDLMLDIASQMSEMSLRDFLASLIEPPAASRINAALKNFVNIGAIGKDGRPSPLGQLLTRLSGTVGQRKSLVLGLVLGTMDSAVILSGLDTKGHIIDFGRSFGIPRQFAYGTRSDHMVSDSPVQILDAFFWVWVYCLLKRHPSGVLVQNIMAQSILSLVRDPFPYRTLVNNRL